MFEAHRIFVRTNTNTGLTEWFFNAREGIFGPYPSEESVVVALNDFVAQRIKDGENAGRSNGRPVVYWSYEFSLTQIEYPRRD